MVMYSEEFFKNEVRPGAFKDGVICCRKSSAAEEFSYFSTRLFFWSTMENRQFFLFEFNRSPERYRLCLANEQTLAACQQCLKDAGYKTQLDTKAKVFLHPEHWPPVLDYLRKCAHSLCRPDDLKVRHVITDEKHRQVLLSALDALPKRLNIKVKREESFCVDVPCKPPTAWTTLEVDFQPGSPAEVQWCEL